MTSARMPIVAVGLGSRRGVEVAAVVSLVQRALARVASEAPVALFAPVEKYGEPAFAQAALELGLPLVHLPKAALQAASDRTVTHSERVVQLFGVPSVAETCALAGAGDGSRIIVPRMTADGVTCAIAIGGTPAEGTRS
ncbi:cobalamin biosynthesis protein [Methylobrevis albus]|uniref:cobalamin biosynthesis protein n=1 Tax=Methylobrevis albus TaxID=2793297 RepID=UPI002E2A889C|nr:cobalamin biosynthesis protein [Methylobrevis albus]